MHLLTGWQRIRRPSTLSTLRDLNRGGERLTKMHLMTIWQEIRPDRRRLAERRATEEVEARAECGYFTKVSVTRSVPSP